MPIPECRLRPEFTCKTVEETGCLSAPPMIKYRVALFRSLGPMPNSIERHTTVSAHPFTIDLEPGAYQLVIERGKEYLPFQENCSSQG